MLQEVDRKYPQGTPEGDRLARYIDLCVEYAKACSYEYGGEEVVSTWLHSDRGINGQAVVLPLDVVIDLIKLGIKPSFNLGKRARRRLKIPQKTIKLHGMPCRIDLPRWIMDVNTRETVSLKTGNNLDMRRSNLEVKDNYMFDPPVRNHWKIREKKRPNLRFKLGDAIVPHVALSHRLPFYPDQTKKVNFDHLLAEVLRRSEDS